MPCPHCGSGADPRLSWRRTATGTLQIRKVCVRCGAFLGCAPQTDGNKAKAGEIPPRPAERPGLFDEE